MGVALIHERAAKVSEEFVLSDASLCILVTVEHFVDIVDSSRLWLVLQINIVKLCVRNVCVSVNI